MNTDDFQIILPDLNKGVIPELAGEAVSRSKSRVLCRECDRVVEVLKPA
jgi:hypothetical protein